jgi:nucleoside-diphosphate-sugar epimerase
MTRVLVTGASGFVGLPLLAELVRRGEEVHAVSTRAAPESIDGVRWHRLDLADNQAVEATVGEVSAERLVHLAWYVEHGHFWSAPENVLWVERSLSLLRAFVRAGGARAVLLGTCAEYDWSAATEPLDERTSALAPATLYGVTKDALRRTATAYLAGEGIELAWARLFFMYGPREQPGRLVPAVSRSLLRGESIATTNGQQVRDFVYVDDVARALSALTAASVQGSVDIASGVGVRVGDLIDALAARIGAPELVRRGALPERPDDPPLLVGAGRRLREEVGYRMQTDLDDGLAATVQWWREHG